MIKPKTRDAVLAALTTVSFAAMLIGAFLPDRADARAGSIPGSASVPADIRAIFGKPLYKNAVWGLRVVDARGGKPLIDLQPRYRFLIGSVRKVFSVGELINQVGPRHTYDTPVYRQGDMDSRGILRGNLILVASGDLTMGGRIKPDGTIAVSNFDHNEADSLGNAVLTGADPLAGYKKLAHQVAAAGVKRVEGEVIIDDRLFQPFNFRNEFDVRPIFVNDDVVDVTINPAIAGNPASVTSRPISAALRVNNHLATSAAGTDYTLKLNPKLPRCIGWPKCAAAVTGELPIDFVPPLTEKFPLVQAFRIVRPSNYARTVFIEALEAAGVKVDAAAVETNPTRLLPARDSYRPNNKLAQLTGMPYSADAKLILKVSYNIGADTSLVLWGLSHGAGNMTAALAAEKTNLKSNYGIPDNEYRFFDGSGGGDTTATNRAVTQMLTEMCRSLAFPAFFDALPTLGVDGSLGFVTDFEKIDPNLAGARGRVHAKTGTYVLGSESGIVLKSQALGGYIDARGGKRLIFELVVNNVKITGLKDVLQVFQDEGTISAILWRDYY